MTSMQAFRTGVDAARRRKLLVLGLYVVNLLAAIVATGPFHGALARVTEMRPFADSLGRGLQFDVMSEITMRHPEVAQMAETGAQWGLVVWIVLGWFLTAGILGVLREPAEATTLRRFGAEALARGFAMMRIQLWSILPYVLAGGVLWIGASVGGAVGAASKNPWMAVVLGAVGALPGLLAVLVVAAAIDCARAKASIGDERSMRRVVWAGFRMVFARPRLTCGVQIWAAALWLGLSAIYLGIAWPFAFASGAAFALLTLLRQVLVFLRTGVRVATLGGTLEVVRRLEVELPVPQARPVTPMGEPVQAAPPPVN